VDLPHYSRCPRCGEWWTRMDGDEVSCDCGCRVTLQCLEAARRGDPAAAEYLRCLKTNERPATN
jgi:hypothetical protein